MQMTNDHLVCAWCGEYVRLEWEHGHAHCPKCNATLNELGRCIKFGDEYEVEHNPTRSYPDDSID